MTQFVEAAAGPEVLAAEQRNLLSTAYKKAIGMRRSSWRIISSLISKNPPNVDTLTEYKEIIEKELKGICNKLLVRGRCIKLCIIKFL